jgi:hypothetical protein
MITSRPNITPEAFLPSIETPEAFLPNLETLDIRASAEDLQKYVNAQIDSSPRLWKHVQNQPGLREDIHAKICNSTVDGM